MGICAGGFVSFLKHKSFFIVFFFETQKESKATKVFYVIFYFFCKLFVLSLKQNINMRKLTKTYLNDLTYQVNGAAIEVHKTWAPGLLETVYHECLAHELTLRGIKFKSELKAPLDYKDLKVSAKLRCDLFVEDCLVVELKAIATILPIHEAQVMTYMKLLKAPKGILYNFNVIHLYSQGQKTFVNEYFSVLPD